MITVSRAAWVRTCGRRRLDGGPSSGPRCVRAGEPPCAPVLLAEICGAETEAGHAEAALAGGCAAWGTCSRSQNIQLVVQSLALSMVSMMHVVMVLLLFYLIFAILGTQMFQGLFYRCSRVNLEGDYMDAESDDEVRPRPPPLDLQGSTMSGGLCWWNGGLFIVKPAFDSRHGALLPRPTVHHRLGCAGLGFILDEQPIAYSFSVMFVNVCGHGYATCKTGATCL